MFLRLYFEASHSVFCNCTENSEQNSFLLWVWVNYIIFVFEMTYNFFLCLMHVGLWHGSHAFLLCVGIILLHSDIKTQKCGVSGVLIMESFSMMSRGIDVDVGSRWPLKLVASARLCVLLPHCAVTSRPSLRRAPLCSATASHLCDTFCLNTTVLKVTLWTHCSFWKSDRD